MTPITVKGFNRDVVVENTASGPPYNSWALELNPAEGNAFYQAGLASYSRGLPADGTFVSVAGDGTTFKFAPYTANNALVMSSQTGQSEGNLVLEAPARYLRVTFIAHSASGGGTPIVQFNFADGSQYQTTYNAADWFNNSGYALLGMERIRLSSGSVEGGSSNPRFYQTTVNLADDLGAANGVLTSITFNKASGVGATAVYAVSGEAAPDMPVSITAEPGDATVVEGSPVVFSAAATGSPMPSAQWYKNGEAISGAEKFSLSIDPAALSDNGAGFRLVAQNVVTGATYYATSRVATLTVNADTNRPVLFGAMSLGLGEVQLSFSERIDAASITNLANYSLSSTNGSALVVGARLDASGSNIVLTVPALTAGAKYQLLVNNITDRAAARNVVAPGSGAEFYAISFAPVAVGNPTPSGAIVPAPDGYDISGGGAGVIGTGDQFQFGHQVRVGDFDVRVRVEALTTIDAWTEAGLMARQELTEGSAFAGVLATPSISGVSFRTRASEGVSAQSTGSYPVNYPNTWLRLKREGNVFTGYGSFDGVRWTSLGSAQLALGNSVYLGFVVSSRNTSQLATAAFRDFGSVVNSSAGAFPVSEPLAQCSRLTSLVISEIMYHPAEAGTFTTSAPSLEFIELFNTRGEPEDISGYRISGAVEYAFPTNTTIPGGGFLVVARDPAALESAYGIAGVLGPWIGADTNGLPNDKGVVRLLHRTGAIFLEVKYSDSGSWPVAADGAGHSLTLTRPSLGERDPRAWAPSALVGGSPGRWNAITVDPLDGVVINEFLAHTDLPQEDFIELYNHSNENKDLSGAWLSDDPVEGKYRFANGTILHARSFLTLDQTALGFALSASGEGIYFANSNRTCVIDAVRFGPQENGVSVGRAPDGSPSFYRLEVVTPGTTNSRALTSPVVINELMFHPPSDDDDDQFLELHNRTDNPIQIGGWRLEDGIDYIFPEGATIPARGYAVVGRNLARLRANYAQLGTSNSYGDFGGRLSHSGERIALAKPHQDLSTNGVQIVTNTTYIVVDEVTYNDQGRWSQWADGGGSSLELIHPDADNRRAGNWADSDETRKVAWTLMSATGTIDNGNVSADQLQVLLQGAGECLIDNVQVIDNTGANRIANSGFESSANGWTAEGTQSTSSRETTEGAESSRSYHIRAVDRADNQINRIRTPLTSTLASGTANVTIRAQARWLKGAPDIVLRLRGNWLECAGTMVIPKNLGTPGQPNSRLVSNAPPAISETTHTPVLPAANEPVVVTARVNDPDGLANVQLKYRIDPATSYTTIAMRDDGLSGDAVAGDGLFSATVPGQASGVLIAFYVSATDSAVTPATAVFPPSAPARECLIRTGELRPTGNFPVYRIWMTQATLNTWTSRNRLDNSPLDVTFVLGDQRAIYNAKAIYAGSPYIAPGYCGPTCSRCGYSLEFAGDDVFLGDRALVLDWPGGHGNEYSAMQEQMGYWVADQLDLPYSHRYTIRLHVNGVTDNARYGVFEAVIQPSGRFIEAWSPDAPDGDLFKIDRAFEFSDGGGLVSAPEPRLANFTTTGGVKKRERYRWTFLYRSTDRTHDYTNLFALVDALNASSPEPYTSATLGLMDVEQWMRIFATEQMIINFDAYGHEIGKNMYAYLPKDGKWQLYMFDLDWLMLAAAGRGSAYAPESATLFNTDDPTISRMYYHPPFRRAFFRAVKDALAGAFNPAKYNAVMDAKYSSLVANGVLYCDGSTLGTPAPVKAWFNARRTYLQSQVSQNDAAFAVSGYQVSGNSAVITGTAPLEVDQIVVNGVRRAVTWTGVTSWRCVVELAPGSNALSIAGRTPGGIPVAGATASLTVAYGGSATSPVGNVVISEIMFAPSVPDAEFVELYNRSSQYTYDLSGWSFSGLDYTFPEGSVILPGRSLLLVKDRVAFNVAYGAAMTVFDEFAGNLQSGGEMLRLLRPVSGDESELVAGVIFAPTGPWPSDTSGSGKSLQLIDPSQDNWRVANWASATATPGAAFSGSRLLATFPPLWINEIQAENLSSVRTATGQRTPWIELFNPGASTVSLAGLYLGTNSTAPAQWAFPAEATLGPGQFKLIFADGQPGLSTLSELHANFTLASSVGSVLLSRIGTNVQPEVLDYITYTNLGADRSYGSIPDAQIFSRREMTYATPGATNNGASAPITVFINEWMADNLSTYADPADQDFEDWFELYNPGTNAVDLGGYYLSDDSTDPLKFQVPLGGFYIVPPQGYLLVWADEEPEQNQTNHADLHVDFRLSKGGEQIVLSAADRTTIDRVTFGAQTTDRTEGRLPDGTSTILQLVTPSPLHPNIGANHAPTLTAIADRLLVVGQTLTLTATASDSDLPVQTLTFALKPGAPADATLNSFSGQLQWTPTSTGAANFEITVSDSGIPSLSASESFTVTVHPVPGLTNLAVTASGFEVTFPSLIGLKYQLEYADDLLDGSWIPATAQVAGTGGPLSLTAPAAAPRQRFYRLRID
jgi:regulation of enolase protein 1 (concanavalin A-like superfamily)